MGDMKRFLAIFVLALGVIPAHADAPVHVATADGPLAILNGLGAVSLHAIAPTLGIPAPAGAVTLVVQSTFEPPGPHVISAQLMCSAVEDGAYFGSGPRTDGGTLYVHLSHDVAFPGSLLWSLNWSTTPASGPCGAPTSPGIPVIGPAAVT
ncbi:MAG: hypothetical protein ABR548_00250 [Actinomycetota bacterium]|nr:hypothetical protein [Actinomycetota bacterium]